MLRSVKKLLQKGIKSSEIIILLRDFSFYAGLRNLSDEYGIPVSLPLTAKLNNEPLTELCICLLKLPLILHRRPQPLIYARLWLSGSKNAV